MTGAVLVLAADEEEPAADADVEGAAAAAARPAAIPIFGLLTAALRRTTGAKPRAALFSFSAASLAACSAACAAYRAASSSVEATGLDWAPAGVPLFAADDEEPEEPA